MDIPRSTVRFTQVVKECGRPDPVTLWTDPKKDPGFQAAFRSDRVMTVIQETVGTQKDFGLVGFHQVEHASYWIFPESLEKFEGKRIIGIKYDLLAAPQPGKNVSKPVAERPKEGHSEALTNPTEETAQKPPPQPHPTKPKPRLARYEVTIRCTATVDVLREVEAKSQKEARETALKILASGEVVFPPEKVRRKVVRTRRVTEA